MKTLCVALGSSCFVSPKVCALRVMEHGCGACGEPVKAHWKACPVCGKLLVAEKKIVPVVDKASPSAAELFREFELIPPQELEWGEQLGEGSYGVVFKGKVRGTPVALKSVKSLEQTVHKTGDAREERMMQARINKQLEVLKQEQNIVRACHNPNILLFLGASRDARGNLVLVSELMDLDLNQYIDKHRQQPSLFLCMLIAFKIAQGMSWIDGVVIHTDLKPSNILLGNLDDGHWTPNSSCKVCDFGLSVLSSLATTVRGTPVYQSPESINGKQATSKTDVFSFGWLCVNLVLWKPERTLFRSIKTAEQLKQFVNDEAARLKFVRRYLDQANCPAVICALIERCLRGGADLRPTFQDIVDCFNSDVLIHSAIRVPNSLAMRFWKKYKLKHEVSFDEFLAAMANEAFLQASASRNHQADEFPFCRDRLHYLRLLFVPDQENSNVTLERFGRICAILGPFDVPQFIAKITTLFRTRWFYAAMPTTTAAFALSNEKAGTFLVRFANSRISDYAISRVYPTEGYIHHLHVSHPMESDVFSLACEDIDMSQITPAQIATLRRTYSSLSDLVNGVSDALQLLEPLVSIPRLLVGQNVKHNGYFVRAFFSDSETEDNASGELRESPLESEEEGVVTPMLSKEYKRAGRMLGVRGVEEDPHNKSSSSQLRGRSLLMSFADFASVAQCPNLELIQERVRPAANEGLSSALVAARARTFFRLTCMDVASGKSFNRQKGRGAVPTRDCGGLLSSLALIQFGLAKWSLMLDLMLDALIAWLRNNGEFVLATSGGKTLSQLAHPVPWPSYVSFLEKGFRLSESDEVGRYGDIFLLTAFANVYFIGVICVTDFVPAELQGAPQRLDNLDWIRSCFDICPAAAAGSVTRFAVLGISCAGRTYHPLLPQKYFDALNGVTSRE